MNTALSWIKAYVPDLDVSVSEYTDKMTLTGTKVEGYKSLDKNLEKIVIGKIMSIKPHPDADRLVVCSVDIGEKTVQIVTGAMNMKEGDIVPVVLDGGKVAGSHKEAKNSDDGYKIKEGKLRGVKSEGMMCGIDELGSSKDYYPEAPDDGLYIFKNNPPLGSDAVEALGLHDTVFEYEITSNRVDCYSILGIAREAAATFKKSFIKPLIKDTGNSEDVSGYLSVEVKEPALCKRFCARVVKNVKFAPSPEWMQRRLAASGIRPINNIVDITNYVMEEYGQPMHAYDYDTLEEHRIVVKCAGNNSSFVTLDGQERKLDSEVLMICDGKKEIGIAGIMGGENSKITEDVKTIVFESACFDGTNIRRSSKRLGMRTDASGKFEKGLEMTNTYEAIQRACSLIDELGAGEVVGGTIDICEPIPEKKQISFNYDYINNLLGTDISKDEMLSYFPPLEIEYDAETNMLTIPRFRQDLLLPADIAEEVARFYGYDNIMLTLPKSTSKIGKLSARKKRESQISDILISYGFSESMSYSFDSPKTFERLRIEQSSKFRDAVKILNPLGEDFSIMKTVPFSGMLNSLSVNYNKRNTDVKLFEFANTYYSQENELLPDERVMLVLGMYGKDDFYYLKGVLEAVIRNCGLSKKLSYERSDNKAFHPGRSAVVKYRNIEIGYLGQLHPDIASEYGIATSSYIGVLDTKTVFQFPAAEKKYVPFAKYPAVLRDISLVMDKEVPASSIEDVIAKYAGKHLESYRLFDVYEGKQIQEGKKSLAYSISFRSLEKTLEETEVNSAMKKITGELSKLGVFLRE